MTLRRSLFRVTILFEVFSLISAVLFFSGCGKDDPEPVNENELITKVMARFVKVNQDGIPTGEDPLIFSWVDSDGDGPGTPVIETILLESNQYYELSLQLLDESKTPAEDITSEIQEEDEEHQFFFTLTGIIGDIAYADEDRNGKPIGITSILTTEGAGEGSLNIVLKHQPDKNAPGVEGGNPSNAGGDTDLDITFPVTIQ